jgi:16S rRNA (adenine(1408)-N(1))-methyltransferase
MFIATDLNPDAMLDTAARAGRKPSRGGVQNLVCIAEAAETLADNLGGIADRVSIILPWGNLLRSIALPEISYLGSLRRLCASDANVEIVFSFDERRDAGQRSRLGLVSLQESHVRGVLRESYEHAGFCVTSTETIGPPALRSYETTWATRLAFGRPREIWRLRLIARAPVESSNGHSTKP